MMKPCFRTLHHEQIKTNQTTGSERLEYETTRATFRKQVSKIDV